MYVLVLIVKDYKSLWEDNIKMDIKEIRFEDAGWNNLPENRDQWRSLRTR
jgi:hypothetical protein